MLHGADPNAPREPARHDGMAWPRTTRLAARIVDATLAADARVLGGCSCTDCLECSCDCPCGKDDREYDPRGCGHHCQACSLGGAHETEEQITERMRAILEPYPMLVSLLKSGGMVPIAKFADCTAMEAEVFHQHFRGLSHNDIASLLDIKKGTVESLLGRAHDRVSAWFKNEFNIVTQFGNRRVYVRAA
jgi:hypothetical protein